MLNKIEIKYLIKILNLEIEDFILFKINEKTKKFIPKNFINFTENNLDHMHLQYKTPMQKFLKICEMFEQEFKIKKEHEIKNDVQKLANKFLKIKVLLQNELIQGRKPMLDEIKNTNSKENYFSDFEISILSKIGDVKYLINLANSHQLEDSISNSLILSLMPATQNNALSFAPNAIKRF